MTGTQEISTEPQVEVPSSNGKANSDIESHSSEDLEISVKSTPDSSMNDTTAKNPAQITSMSKSSDIRQ